MIQARVKGDGCEIQIQGNADTMRQEFMGIVRGMHGALAEHTGSAATATTLLLSLFTAGMIECMDSDDEDDDEDEVDDLTQIIHKALRDTDVEF